MLTPLQSFLIGRKLELLAKEKQASGIAQVAMTAQIQFADAMLWFLSSQQTEDDMEKLRLTLDKHATPVDDIKPRQENAELTDAIIALAKELDEQFKEQKEKKIIKFPLNNIPADVKPKSIGTKIYALRSIGKVPLAILPKLRTVKDNTGKAREVIYMVRVTDDIAKRYEKKPKARSDKGE